MGLNDLRTEKLRFDVLLSKVCMHDLEYESNQFNHISKFCIFLRFSGLYDKILNPWLSQVEPLVYVPSLLVLLVDPNIAVEGTDNTFQDKDPMMQAQFFVRLQFITCSTYWFIA